MSKHREKNEHKKHKMSEEHSEHHKDGKHKKVATAALKEKMVKK